VQGTEGARQELHRVAVRVEGGAIREDEPLDGDDAPPSSVSVSRTHMESKRNENAPPLGAWGGH
jgi:hypothetical protein